MGLGGGWGISPMKKIKLIWLTPKKPPSKRSRRETDTDSENEQFLSGNNWPRFLIMRGTDESLPLDKLTPFAVQKGFQAIAGTLKSTKRLRDGCFLVECLKRILLKTVKFVDRAVQFSVHKTLNSSRGVIQCRELTDMTETEIRDELKDQGVVGVRRVTVKKGGESVPTNTLFLTFNRPELPTAIKVGYLQVKVVMFIPNPLRCFNCNKFGHTRKRCKSTAKCELCGKDKHYERCDGPKICSNCSGPHASSSRDCPVWQREKEIQRIRVEKRISFPEARQLIEGRSSSAVPVNANQKSYSSVVATRTQTKNIECQTDLTF